MTCRPSRDGCLTSDSMPPILALFVSSASLDSAGPKSAAAMTPGLAGRTIGTSGPNGTDPAIDRCRSGSA